MEQLRRKHQFSELNYAGWEDRSGSPWPKKVEPPHTVVKLHTLHRAPWQTVSGG